MIETWGFREFINDIVADNDNDNDKDSNNGKGISALGHDRDMEFSRGHQGCQEHRPHDDDDNEEEDDKVGNNDEDDNNNKDDNNDKGISALGLDRDMGISRLDRDLLKELRKLGLGCYMAGKWMGATAYADDLLLMSPTRSGMQAMLAVCQKYAEAHNITFSVDANPTKSKTKMLYVCGDMEYENYPAQLVFCGRPLPFVKTALHLGHTLSQDGTMAQDAKIRRAQYIDRTTDVRTMFHFANPEQMLAAADKYCGDHYGVMLYNLYDEGSEKYFRCWGTLTKLSWNVPRGTHKYFVPNLLSAGHMSTRTKILGRYVNFFRSLLKSECEEVALVANIAGRDRSSTTGINLAHIQAETGLNPWNTKSYAIMQEQRDREETIPPREMWRVPFFQKLLLQRHVLEVNCEDTKELTKLIDSLCIS